MISEAKAFCVLILEYISPTVGNEWLFSCKLILVITRHFVTRAYIVYNDHMITKCRVSSEIIVRNVQ